MLQCSGFFLHTENCWGGGGGGGDGGGIYTGLSLSPLAANGALYQKASQASEFHLEHRNTRKVPKNDKTQPTQMFGVVPLCQATECH